MNEINDSLSRATLDRLTTSVDAGVKMVKSTEDHLYEQIGIYGLEVLLAVEAAKQFEIDAQAPPVDAA